jgi:hypothetical protein
MILTTHEYNRKGHCVGCGALARNGEKRPDCKVLNNGNPDQVDVRHYALKSDHTFFGKNGICVDCNVCADDADYDMVACKRRGHRAAEVHDSGEQALSLLETPKKKFHHFGSSDACIYCGLLLGNEPNKPLCPRKGNAVPAAKSAPAKKYEACHVTHPVLKFGKLEIHGGSCNSPKVKGCDVYIGFDSGMQMTMASMPWKRETKGHVEEVYYHVADMTAPRHPKEFKALVEWTLEQMKAGKKVHAGCIGGHGRTGTFFAALAATQTEVPVEDAIQFVRDNYCAKAVECDDQIKFLKKHFGVETKVKGSKSWTGSSKGSKKKISSWASRWQDEDDDFDVIKPEHGPNNVWGRSLDEGDI